MYMAALRGISQILGDFLSKGIGVGKEEKTMNLIISS